MGTLWWCRDWAENHLCIGILLPLFLLFLKAQAQTLTLSVNWPLHRALLKNGWIQNLLQKIRICKFQIFINRIKRVHEPYLQDSYITLLEAEEFGLKFIHWICCIHWILNFRRNHWTFIMFKKFNEMFLPYLGIGNLSLLLCNDRKNIRMFFFVVFSSFFL